MKFEVVNTLTSEQINQLYQLFQLEWWTKGRELTDIKKMIEHSDVIIGICDNINHELIGFVRILTDFVYKALILDVIVKDSYRGKDLGRTLIDAIYNTQSLKAVNHFELYCRPEMEGFYKKWGFTKELGELSLMRMTK